MPRKPLIRQGIYPYHVVNRSNNKEWFQIPLKEVWRIALYSMQEANKKHPIELISFVLMSNHYHMILKTPHCDLDKFMYEFNKKFSQLLKQRSGHINKMFGGRYKWCLIKSDRYFSNCYRYVFQNPKRAGVVSNCENYPYSTLHHQFHNKRFPLTIFDRYGFIDEMKLRWINEDISEEEVLSVRNGLRKFELHTLKNNRKLL